MSKLINFRELSLKDAELTLNWRIKHRITKFQFTDIKRSIPNQKKWINNSFKRKDYYHWIINYKKIPIGLISINDLNLKNKSTTWGYYIGSEKYLTLGAVIPAYFYNWVFKNFRINKIYAFVISNNLNVIKLHKFHNYKILKQKIFIKKNKKILLLKKLLLSKYKWDFKSYQKCIANFPINKWKHK